MPIRLQCPKCSKKFTAWDDAAGTVVQCPKCNQGVRVGSTQSKASTKESPRTASEKRATKRDTSELRPPLSQPIPRDVLVQEPPTGSQTNAPQEQQPPAKGQTPSKKQTPSKNQTPPAPPAVRGQAAPPQAPSLVEDDFDDSDELPYSCPNCHAAMPAHEDLCDECGFHQVLGKVIDLDGIDRPDKSTGFERTLKKHLSETTTAESALLWFRIFLAFIALSFVAFLRLALGRFGLVLGLILVGTYVAYHFLHVAKHRDEESAINRDPLLSLLWSLFLIIQRAAGWRELAWPFPAAKSFRAADSNFGDDELAKLENLTEIQALDLEGTRVSDASVSFLVEHPQLRFVVLRKTNVTPRGAQRLQNSLQDAVIWH